VKRLFSLFVVKIAACARLSRFIQTTFQQIHTKVESAGIQIQEFHSPSVKVPNWNVNMGKTETLRGRRSENQTKTG